MPSRRGNGIHSQGLAGRLRTFHPPQRYSKGQVPLWCVELPSRGSISSLNDGAGLREGYFRSAAEFLPHASWLMKSSTEPSTACSCRFCSKPRAAATGTTPPWPASPKPRLPSTSKTLLDAVLKEPAPGSPPPPPGGDRATATPPQSPTRGGVRRSKRLLVNRNPEIAPVQTSRIIAYYVRIPTPVDSSASSCNHQSPTGLWPISHELVWCRLQKPLEGSSATIYFWPGIIKSHEERSTGTIFHVSPLGNKHDIPFKIDQLLPYQAYRMEGTLVRELHRHATGSSRISLLNLEKVAGSKLDDDRFSIISSTCIFAIEFCQQLSVVWSCTADQGPHQPSSPTHRLRSGGQPGLQTPRYPRRKEYNTLWWGPERIRSQQMVRLKVPLSSIHLNQKASNAQFVQWVEGSSHKATVFLKIRSIFSESSEVRKDALSTTPFVSGGLFALIFESDPRGELPPNRPFGELIVFQHPAQAGNAIFRCHLRAMFSIRYLRRILKLWCP